MHQNDIFVKNSLHVLKVDRSESSRLQKKSKYMSSKFHIFTPTHGLKHFKFATLHTLDLLELVLQPRGLWGSSSSSPQVWRCRGGLYGAGQTSHQAWWCRGGLYGAGQTSHQAWHCVSSFLPVELPCVPAVAQTSGAGGQHHPEFDGARGAAADFWWCYSSFTSELFSSLHVAACFAPRWVLFGQQCHVRPGDVFRASSHALQTVWAAFPGLPRSCRWTMCPLSCFWPAWLWWWQDAFHLL